MKEDLQTWLFRGKETQNRGLSLETLKCSIYKEFKRWTMKARAMKVLET